MADRVKEQIRQLIEAPLAEQECEIAELVLSRYKNLATVKLFLYGVGGVNLVRCQQLSRLIGDLIDGSDLFDAGYALEVSSPGLSRPLKESMDFKYRIGETVRLEFVDRKKKKVTAKIVAVNNESAEFENEDGRFTCALDRIEQAKIVF